MVEYLDHETGKKEIEEGPDFNEFVVQTIFLGSLLNHIKFELEDAGNTDIQVKLNIEPERLPRLVITRSLFDSTYYVDFADDEPLLWPGNGFAVPLLDEGATLDHKAVRQAYRAIGRHLGIR